ncbi:uncharacterized protein CDV56_104911 [Aspergillus thermomutatus]|uniref:Xylanolytic transcriptional activator regulatory domain-containing protein n=1 Tax=Aspergillus thermomutatus TaxID=41047 RepID=A0A397GV80_ASPTH|nr:uncharacterized protein CDV56_104911 [Aspergillus thermomutatus]RHZ53434.1 hypothetical protein CDV56_104911 [Aspergillus thermomutatus]
MRPITWPRIARKCTAEGHHGDRQLSLPEKSLLFEQIEAFQKSICGQILPLINRACFEYTIRAAYDNELSDISPGVSSARVCIFAFMALSSFFTGHPHYDKIVTADEYAREAQDLLPEMLNESVTLDGLQALAMLCLCCQAISGDMLSIELMLSSATRFAFHLKGNVYPEAVEGDHLGAKLHVRNLFWICFILDKIFSLRTGLQPFVDVTNCDLTLPGMQTANGQLDRLQPFCLQQHNHTMFLTLIRLCQIQSKIYQGLYSFSAQRQSDADLLATIRSLDIALEEWRSSVPTFSGRPIHSENRMADFLFDMQYHYCMAAIHQTSSRCTAWVRNQDTCAAGSSLALSVGASRSVLRKFLETDPQREGQFLLFCLPELSTSTIHLFSNILMSPLEDRSETDLCLMRVVLEHLGKHIWRQTPTTFIAQVRLVEGFMGDLYRLAEMAILKARRERSMQDSTTGENHFLFAPSISTIPSEMSFSNYCDDSSIAESSVGFLADVVRRLSLGDAKDSFLNLIKPIVMASFKKMTLALASLAPTALASSAPEKMTVGVIGDFGWTGFQPAPLSFCNDVMPRLIAENITIPREVQNDCDPGDRAAVSNATALQGKFQYSRLSMFALLTLGTADTAAYIGKVCEKKNCSAFVSVGDNFYDSGVDFTTAGINRFQEAWVDMYRGGVFDHATWYQCLGNHDVVKGQSGVDFETKVAPLYDSRWYFGTTGEPYYTYDLKGADWTATFVVVDSDCFIEKYQESTSVYQNEYTTKCHQARDTQVAFLEKAFAESEAEWKFLQLHHGYMSAAGNNTDVAPLISVVEKHGGVVLNGHDHCLAHFYNNNTNFILAGGAGYPEVGDCNYGVPLGPYTKWLGANSQSAANGFVTMDISREEVNVEFYARDMQFEGGDLYPVKNDMNPSYSFKIKTHARRF